MRNTIPATLLLVFLAACSTTGKVSEQKITSTDVGREYFSTELAESFKPGVAVMGDVVGKLGAPYITDRVEAGERYVYMQTLKRQAIYTFKGDSLVAFEWSEAYGHPALPKDEKQ